MSAYLLLTTQLLLLQKTGIYNRERVLTEAGSQASGGYNLEDGILDTIYTTTTTVLYTVFTVFT